jgi:hypothetical protein
MRIAAILNAAARKALAFIVAGDGFEPPVRIESM